MRRVSNVQSSNKINQSRANTITCIVCGSGRIKMNTQGVDYTSSLTCMRCGYHYESYATIAEAIQGYTNRLKETEGGSHD